MKLNGMILNLPKELKLLIAVFLVVLSIGFYTGLLFVDETSSSNPNGVEEQYIGNESDENARIMKFKKSKKEMLTLVHNHILSMSIIFFLLGLIICITKLNIKLKLFLIIEPFVSVILTFGGLYLLWSGILWMKYVVMFSGILMTVTYSCAVLIALVQLVNIKK